MRTQLRRASDKYGSMNTKMQSRAISQPLLKDLDLFQPGRAIRTLHVHNIGNIDHEVSSAHESTIPGLLFIDGSKTERLRESRRGDSTSSVKVFPADTDRKDGSLLVSDEKEDILGRKILEDESNKGAVAIPDDFLCPISLEIMRDPVIVATGQVNINFSNPRSWY